MSTAAEQQIVDQEIRFENPNLVSRDKTRYVFFPGDVLSARAKQERRDLAHGGEILPGYCSWRTSGFLRRCRITPLEVAAVPTPIDLIPEGMETVEMQMADAPGTPDSQAALTGLSGSARGFGVKWYPGDEIAHLLTAGNDDGGTRRGMVEITALQGDRWDRKKMDEIQQFFFPGYPALPVTLRGIENLIHAALAKRPDSALQSIGEQMLAACEEFRLWGASKIEVEQQLLSLGTTAGGHTYRYSPLGLTLLDQLEIPRADQGMQTMANLTGEITRAVVQQQTQAQAPGFDKEAMYEFMQSNAQMIAQVVAQTVAQTMAGMQAQQPAPEAAPAEAPKGKSGGK